MTRLYPIYFVLVTIHLLDDSSCKPLIMVVMRTADGLVLLRIPYRAVQVGNQRQLFLILCIVMQWVLKLTLVSINYNLKSCNIFFI